MLGMLSILLRELSTTTTTTMHMIRHINKKILLLQEKIDTLATIEVLWVYAFKRN